MDYSTEQKNSMFKGVLKYVKESMDDSGLDAVVTTEQLESITDMPLNEDVILANKSYFSDHFAHVSAMYGFDNFLDLYYYAESNKEIPIEKNLANNKDYDNLNRVTRTVVRNGQPIEMTIYEDPKDNNQGTPSSGFNSRDENTDTMNASLCAPVWIGKETFHVTNKELIAVKKYHKGINGNHEFVSGLNLYLLLVNSEMSPVAIVGFNVTNDFIRLEFWDQSPNLTGTDTRAFFELIKLGIGYKKSIQLPHLGTRQFDILSEEHKMDIENGYFVSTFEDIEQLYGGLL